MTFSSVTLSEAKTQMTFSSVTLSEAKGLKILRFAQNDNVVIFKLYLRLKLHRRNGSKAAGGV